MTSVSFASEGPPATARRGSPAEHRVGTEPPSSVDEDVSKQRHDAIQETLATRWSTGCLLTKQFAIALVQTCPDGAHDLKTIFFSDFDNFICKRLEENAAEQGQLQDAHGAAGGMWSKLSKSRKQVLAAMTGAIDAEGGDFVANTHRLAKGSGAATEKDGNDNVSDDDENRGAQLASGSALTSEAALRVHLAKFGNLADALMQRSVARTLVALNAPTFVMRALRVLASLSVVSLDIEAAALEPMLEALRWRQIDGLGLRAPIADTEGADDYLSGDDDASGDLNRDDYDADTYFQLAHQKEQRRLKCWEREVREQWYVLRELPAVEGQLQFFGSLPVLCYALYDLFLGSMTERSTGKLRWNSLVEFLGDCSNDGGQGGDQQAGQNGEVAPSDTVLRAMRESVDSIPFLDVSRGARIIPWLARNTIVVYEIDRKEEERISLFDASVLRPNRSSVWPSHYGKVSHVVVATELAALLVATFDVIRVVDADNNGVKFMHRVEDPITAVQWVPDALLLVIGTRAGSVHAFRLRHLDALFYGSGSRAVTSLAEEDVFAHKTLHTDAITHICDRALPGTSILVSSLDTSLTNWSLESGVVRRMLGAVALGFEILPTLSLVFAYGVELFPMLWAYTVANSKPVTVGGAKKGFRPHQGRIIGVKPLSFPKNSGCSIDRLGGVKVWDLWEHALLQNWSLVDHIPATVNSRGITFQSFFVAPNERDLFVVSSRLFCKVELMKPEDALRAPIASNAPIHALAHCPELRLFVSAQRNSLTLWNAVTSAPITTYDNISPVPLDEILLMKVYETPNREVRVGTKLGCVITVALGNGSIRHVYRHPMKRDILCFAYVAALELLVASCERSARSIVPGDEKSFVLPQKTALGFASVCLHKATMLLLAGHDDEVRCTIWDVSPTTPNMWVRLCDVTIPQHYLDTSLASSTRQDATSAGQLMGTATGSVPQQQPHQPHEGNGSTAASSIGCALIEDFAGTPFFALTDTTSQIYICQIGMLLDGVDILSPESAAQSPTTAVPVDEVPEDGEGIIESSLDAASRRMSSRRKSTLFDRCLDATRSPDGEPVPTATSPQRSATGGVAECSEKTTSGNASHAPLAPTSKARRRDALRTVAVTVRQIVPHRLHKGQCLGSDADGGDLSAFVPTITALCYLHAFGMLYVADDLGNVSIYDIAQVLLYSVGGATPSGGSMTHRSNTPSAGRVGSPSSSSGGVTEITTTFKNTRPKHVDDLVLAEQLWGKTDLPFAVTLDDRLAEMSNVFDAFVPGNRKNKRRGKHNHRNKASIAHEDGASLWTNKSLSEDAITSSQSLTHDASMRDFLVRVDDDAGPLGALQPRSLTPSDAAGSSTSMPTTSHSSTEADDSQDEGDLKFATFAPTTGHQGTMRPQPGAMAATVRGKEVADGGDVPTMVKSVVSVNNSTHRPRKVKLAASTSMHVGSTHQTFLGLSHTRIMGDSRTTVEGPNASSSDDSAWFGRGGPMRLSGTDPLPLPNNAVSPSQSKALSPKSQATQRFAAAASKRHEGPTQTTTLPPIPSATAVAAPARHDTATAPTGIAQRKKCSVVQVPAAASRDVVDLVGIVYLVHHVEAHPQHSIPSLLLLDAPLVSIVTCAKDRMITMWTLFMKPIGRLALSADNRASIFAKFARIKASSTPASRKSSLDALRRRRSRKLSRRKSMAPRSAAPGRTAEEESQEWERMFCMGGDRLSIFDDVPKRFRRMKRSPMLDWQVEMDRLTDSVGDTMGGGGAVDSGDDEGPVLLKRTGSSGGQALPMKPIRCTWDFLMGNMRSGLGQRTNSQQSSEATGGDVTLLNALQATMSSVAAQAALHRNDGGGNYPGDAEGDGARSFFLTAAGGFPDVEGAQSAIRRPPQVSEKPPEPRELPKKTAEQLRLTHEQKISICYGWFFGMSLELAANSGKRSVERILALKNMGQLNLDDVVNDVLLAQERKAEAEAQKRLDQANQACAARETREMKLLLSATTAVSAPLDHNPSNTGAASNGYSPSISRGRKGCELVLKDGEVLDAADARLAPPALGYAPQDEAWLSRVVLKQLEPTLVVLPVSSNDMIEHRLEERRTGASSPPALAAATAERLHDMASVQAHCAFKERANAWEVMPQAQRDAFLRSTEHMPMDAFAKQCLQPNAALARRDLAVAEETRRRRMAARSGPSLPPIVAAMMVRRSMDEDAGVRVAARQRDIAGKHPNPSVLSSTTATAQSFASPCESPLEREQRLGRNVKTERAAGGHQTASKILAQTHRHHSDQRFPLHASSAFGRTLTPQPHATNAHLATSRNATPSLQRSTTRHRATPTASAEDSNTSEFLGMTSRVTLHNRGMS